MIPHIEIRKEKHGAFAFLEYFQSLNKVIIRLIFSYFFPQFSIYLLMVPSPSHKWQAVHSESGLSKKETWRQPRYLWTLCLIFSFWKLLISIVKFWVILLPLYTTYVWYDA